MKHLVHQGDHNDFEKPKFSLLHSFFSSAYTDDSNPVLVSTAYALILRILRSYPRSHSESPDAKKPEPTPRDSCL
jgi:hypothetical protein